MPAGGAVAVPTPLLPHKGIDLFETDLPDHLRRFGTTHLVICGLTANLCCESTGRRAMEKGLDVTFLSHAIGAESVMAYEASRRLTYPLVANHVITVDEFLAALGTPSERLEVRPGDLVSGPTTGRSARWKGRRAGVGVDVSPGWPRT